MIQGVFVAREGKAVFVPVQTGITGVTNIEVRAACNEGDTIITGTYQALRTLRSGARMQNQQCRA